MPGNAANYAAGLGVSTATHGCSDNGMMLCQGVAAFSGAENTRVTKIIDTINQATSYVEKFTNAFDKYFANPLYKSGSYIVNFKSRYNNAKQYCQETCDKQRWEK